MATERDLSVPQPPAWCPGCGNFLILKELKEAIGKLAIPPEKVCVCSGIGQAAKLPHHINVYGFHSLHGRAIPVATGVRLANHGLTVIAVGGDGDGYSMGLGHTLHAMRRNLDITYLVHNNQVYGLTKGQYSPTSDPGFRTRTSPRGAPEVPVQPLALAVAAGCTFVARGYYKAEEELRDLICEAIRHKGFALIDVIQHCVSYNPVNTPEWFDERRYLLSEEGHDPSDRAAAFRRAIEWGERIPFGVFYREERPTYEDKLPQLEAGPLAERPLEDIDIEDLMETFL